MGNCDLGVTVCEPVNDTVRCISVSSLQFKILCRCSGKSTGTPTSVLDGLLMLHWINRGPIGRTLNVDSLTIASFYATLSPSDPLCDVLDLSQTSQALSHLRSSKTQATGTVCFAARLSLCSVSYTESTTPMFSAPQESLNTDVKYHYVFPIPIQFPIPISHEMPTKPFASFAALWSGQ